MSLLPESLRGRAKTLDTDPFRYLRGVITFFMGGGAVVALVLGLTGVEPRALLLAGLLWALFGFMSGMLEAVLDPLIEFLNTVLTNVGLTGRAEGSRRRRPSPPRATPTPRPKRTGCGPNLPGTGCRP